MPTTSSRGSSRPSPARYAPPSPSTPASPASPRPRARCSPVNFGGVLLVVGGFLLGGSWAVWRINDEGTPRSGPQIVLAVIVLLAALLATASGILRLV